MTSVVSVGRLIARTGRVAAASGVMIAGAIANQISIEQLEYLVMVLADGFNATRAAAYC